MHKHSQCVDRYRDCSRLVAVLVLESLDLIILHLAAHRPHVRGAFRQRGWRSGRAGRLDLDIDVGIEAFELFRPQSHEIRQRVRTDTGEVAGNTAGHGIFGQTSINIIGSQGSCAAQPAKEQCKWYNRFNQFHRDSPRRWIRHGCGYRGHYMAVI